MFEDPTLLNADDASAAGLISSQPFVRYDYATVRRQPHVQSLNDMFPDLRNPYFSLLDACPSFSQHRDLRPNSDILHQCLSIVLNGKYIEDRECALDLICCAACENSISTDPLFRHVAQTRLHLIYMHELKLPVGFQEKALRHLMISAPDCDPTDPYLRPIHPSYPEKPIKPFPYYPRPEG